MPKKKYHTHKSCTTTTFCKSLRELAFCNYDGIGLTIYTYRHGPTGVLTRHVPVLRTEKGKKHGGTALNYCPWCGFDLFKRYDYESKLADKKIAAAEAERKKRLSVVVQSPARKARAADARPGEGKARGRRGKAQ